MSPVQADSAQPDEASTKGLQPQIDAINKRLDRLEHLLRTNPPHPVDQDTTDSGTGGNSGSSPVQPGLSAFQEIEALNASWKQLRRGLSRSEVEMLLGKPLSELTLGRQTLWYYRYPAIGGGSVMLGNSGKVTSWQKPPFRGW